MKVYGKRMVSISIVLIMTLSGLITTAPASVAMPSGDDSKIKIESVTWDRNTQGFVVALSFKFGLATAGENADFSVMTKISFEAGGIPSTLIGESAVRKAEGATKDSDNMITIDPSFIPWDRNGGKFEGLLDVTATIELINSGNDGDGIGNLESSNNVQGIELLRDDDGTGTIEYNCWDGIDNDEDGLIDCDDDDCTYWCPPPPPTDDP
jgi:hypothetical protein